MSIMLDLKDKTAIVTGASGELGRVMAFTLAEAGANVILHYLNNEEGVIVLKNKIDELGVKSFIVKGDVGSEGEVKNIYRQISSDFIVPNIVITCAVTQYRPWSSILDEKIENYRSQYESSILQNVLFAKAFIPDMIKNKWGRFIGINTECIMQMFPGQSAYISGKRGMDGVLRVLAKEVGSSNITVNQVAPGETISNKDRVSNRVRNSKYLEKLPLGRRGTDQEIANVVAFLASDLSSYITGAYIPVCGGNVMPTV